MTDINFLDKIIKEIELMKSGNVFTFYELLNKYDIKDNKIKIQITTVLIEKLGNEIECSNIGETIGLNYHLKFIKK